MNFRRGYPARRPMLSSRSYGFRFRRPFARATVKDRVTRLQRCQFTFFGNTTPTTGTALTATNVVFQLAHTRSLGEASTGQGRALTDWIKSIDIMSIHLDWGIDCWSTNIGYGTEIPSQASWMTHVALMVDRTDTSGTPIAAPNTAWWGTTSPVAATAAAAPFTTVDELEFPTRVLYEKFNEFNYGLYHVQNVTANEFAQTAPRVRGRLGGFFKRSIRVRLNDEQGLYWGFSYAPNNSLNAPRTMMHWASGALYYKVNF